MRFSATFLALLLLTLSPLTRGSDVVFSEDFEHFDRKNWDDISDKAGAIQIVDGGLHGKCA